MKKLVMYVLDVLDKVGVCGSLFDKLYDKYVIILIIIVLFGGAFEQLTYASLLVDNKKDSYKEVKDIGVWIKDNTPENSVVFVQDAILSEYYSDRESYWIGNNESLFKENLIKHNGQFIVLSNLAYHEQWMYEFVNKYNLQPVQFIGDINKQFGIVFYINNSEVYK